MERELVLRKFQDGDLPLFKKWLDLPHVARWYHDPADWIDEVEKRNGEFHWLHHFIAEFGGRPIGFCQYYAYHNSGETWHGEIEIDGTYSIDYLVGEPEFLGHGYGKAMVQKLVRKTLLESDAMRIIVQPESENHASCQTLCSCGFHFDEANKLYLLSKNMVK